MHLFAYIRMGNIFLPSNHKIPSLPPPQHRLLNFLSRETPIQIVIEVERLVGHYCESAALMEH